MQSRLSRVPSHTTLIEPAPDSALGRAVRIVTTGSGFLLFALGCLLIPPLVFLPILLLPVSWQRKRSYSRWIFSQFLRLYLSYFRCSGLILGPQFTGLEHLRHSGQLIVSSHPSLIDVLFLISLVRQTNCIVKEMLWRNPITFAAMHALGYIRNDAPDLMEQCAASLRRGDSLIVFPEGTRTRPGQPLKFLRGAANIALTAEQDITPVVIRCHPMFLRKGQKWYQVPDRTPRYSIDVYPPIAVAPYLDGEQGRSLAARRLTRDLEQFFTERYSGDRA